MYGAAFFVVMIFTAAVALRHFFRLKSGDAAAHEEPISIVLYLGWLFLFVLLWTVSAFDQQEAIVEGLILIFCYSITLFIFISEAMLTGFANYLNVVRGDRWTKEIDYVYLVIGFIGLIFSIRNNGIFHNNKESHRVIFECVGPIIVATAMVVRAMKTRAEINKWNSANSGRNDWSTVVNKL